MVMLDTMAMPLQPMDMVLADTDILARDLLMLMLMPTMVMPDTMVMPLLPMDMALLDTDTLARDLLMLMLITLDMELKDTMAMPLLPMDTVLADTDILERDLLVLMMLDQFRRFEVHPFSSVTTELMFSAFKFILNDFKFVV